MYIQCTCVVTLNQMCYRGESCSICTYMSCWLLPVCRMYCTRRLQRMRRSLHFTQGHRNKYHKKPITLELAVKDVR